LSRFDRGTDAKADRARTRRSSASRRTSLIRRLRGGRPRRDIAFLTLLFIVGLAGVALAAPGGTIISQDPDPSQGLGKAGPVNPANGFPDWYRDKASPPGRPASITLEPCLEPKNPMCIIGDVPNPDAPLNLDSPDPTKNNFPDEFFYFLADSNIANVGSTAAPGNARLVLAIEGAFATGVKPGDQMVFARLRVRVTDGLVGDRDYKVTQPYGTTVIHTDPDDPTLFVTEDIGITPGAFNDALNGRIGPFLQWTDDGSPVDQLPPGYIGDPTVDHTVTGSPTGNNLFRIEGPNVGQSAAPANRCPGALNTDDCVQTELFSLMGKKATRSGVTVQQSTYARTKDGDASMNILAEANAQQNLVVQDSDAARRLTPQRQFPTTQLESGDVNYFAHVDLAGPAPAAIPDDVEVANASDVPVTRKRALLTDAVTATATYDATAHSLHIEAGSSDDLVTASGPAAHLTYEGEALQADTSGTDVVWTLDKAMTAPPATVRVQSDRGLDGKGGSIEVPVTLTGGFSPVAALRANAGADSQTRPGRTVALNGSGSTGNIETYHWTGPYAVNADGTLGDLLADGPAIANADQADASFVAPDGDAEQKLGFRLEVTGAQAGTGLDRLTDDVVVTNTPAAAQVDDLQFTTARYTAAQRRWVVDGTSTALADNEVTIHIGATVAGPVLGRATVDRLGNWSLDIRDVAPIPDASGRVSVESTAGGRNEGFVLDIRGTPVAPAPAPAATAATAGTAGVTALRAPAAAAPAALAAAVPLAGAAARAAARVIAAPAVLTRAALTGAGVPVTVAVPAGASLVRLRVLTTAGSPLLSTFRKVKGGTRTRLRIRSARLRRKLRAGRRYVIEVRAGTARNRLGKATRRTVRVR
jgi:hypothetical protein